VANVALKMFSLLVLYQYLFIVKLTIAVPDLLLRKLCQTLNQQTKTSVKQTNKQKA
jgi:hypothetical protein